MCFFPSLSHFPPLLLVDTIGPPTDGCLDLRMGTSDKNSVCGTCGLKLADCAGHFGFVRLELPVFHIGFFKTLLTILGVICTDCSRLLLHETDRLAFLKRIRAGSRDALGRKSMLKEIIALCKKSQLCERCGGQNGTVKKVGALKLVHERYKASTKARKDHAAEFYARFATAAEANKDMKPHVQRAQEDLNPLKVLEILKRIPDCDVELLDMDPLIGRPENLIVTHLLVPPVCIRPSVVTDASSGSNEDDITMKLAEIVHINNVIRAALRKGATVPIVVEDWDFLQLQCAMLINAELPGIPAPMQPRKPLRGYCQRLKGKTGRFRGNLSGKRVDFSSRTVISPDPNIGIDEVVVPVLVAKTLTYPDLVFDHNIERLRAAVRNGVDIHPGANFIVYPDGRKRFLKYGDRDQIAAQLRVGDKVERHLRDDDIVLFNRQPSLHKVSIMAHRARVQENRTFRFNECVCAPYNADFDGDEMNLHLPQTEEAKAEAVVLMATVQNLVTPRNGEPLIAATQDFITGAYLLTRKDRFFDRNEFQLLCGWAYDCDIHIDIPPPTIMRPVELWTGKQVFSVMLNATRDLSVRINLEGKSKSYTEGTYFCPKDGWVCIQNSELICGVIDKAMVGDGNKNSVFAVLMRDFGPYEAAFAMGRLSKLAARYLSNYGFSIGIQDVTPGDVLVREKKLLVSDGYEACAQRIKEFQAGQLVPQPGCNEEETLESMLNGILSTIRETAGMVCLRELNQHHCPPLTMAVCGSKGSTINISQMVACVGQQTVSGARIPNGFADRSLPHFNLRSREPPAKGFVQNSFFTGLTPTEFFFHTMGGREGLVDTAVKTAETGYMQRRLMKSLEDLSTQYDETVRNSNQTIIQFTYGDDSLDPAEMEGKDRPVDFERVLLHCIAAFSRSQMGDEADPRGSDQWLPPSVMKSSIDAHLSSERASKTSVAFQEELRETIFKQADRLERLMVSFNVSEDMFAEDDVMSDQLIVDSVCHISGLTRRELDQFADLCLKKYEHATVEAGTAVGAISAQSIGEPGTQMTLKTFHFAGVASMNITLGVPRIKEIINAAKTISTPIVTATLVNDSDEAAARIVKGRIEQTTLGQVCESIVAIREPDRSYMVVTLDLECIEALQLEIDIDIVRNAILRDKRLRIKDPQTVLTRDSRRLDVHPVERVATTAAQKSKVIEGGELHFALQKLQNLLPSVLVCGIPDVSRAVISVIEGSKPERFNLLVEGSAFDLVMATPGVVGTKTRSNHTMMVETALGIEAARQTIMNEIQYTMRSHGMIIDTRHVMLLADVMTFRGVVLGITRFGLAKMKDSALMLASFEQTTDHLFDAAVHSRKELVSGVSECIILGVPVPIGTGLFKVIYQPHDEVLNTIADSRPALALDYPEMTAEDALTRWESNMQS
jgi:DNA-directed RNA polymerase III subunit RPC1